MDLAAEFTAFAHEGLPVLEYNVRFCQLTLGSHFDDKTLKSLYWVGANYYNPLDLPEISKGTWREPLLKCMECTYPLLILSNTANTDNEPKPNADQETQKMYAMDPVPEPVPAMEPEPAASSIPETKPAVQFDQVCELVYICVSGSFSGSG